MVQAEFLKFQNQVNERVNPNSNFNTVIKLF